MKTGEMLNDPTMRTLAGLQILEPDRQRADRTRAKCRAVIDRELKWNLFVERVTASFSRRILAPAVVGGACAAFLIDVAWRALQLYGF